MVTTKKHIPSLLELVYEDDQLIRDLLAVVQEVTANVTREQGACRVLTNLGNYQDSKHLHVHVICGDQLWLFYDSVPWCYTY